MSLARSLTIIYLLRRLHNVELYVVLIKANQKFDVFPNIFEPSIHMEGLRKMRNKEKCCR